MVNFMSEHVLMICFTLQVVIPFIWTWNQFNTYKLCIKHQTHMDELSAVLHTLFKLEILTDEQINFLYCLRNELALKDISSQGWRLPTFYTKRFSDNFLNEVLNIRYLAVEYGAAKIICELSLENERDRKSALEKISDIHWKLFRSAGLLYEKCNMRHDEPFGSVNFDLVKGAGKVAWVKLGITVVGYLAFLYNF